jgi:hypothetical protein
MSRYDPEVSSLWGSGKQTRQSRQSGAARNANEVRDGDWLYWIASRSTTNTSVSFGPIAGGNPCAP